MITINKHLVIVSDDESEPVDLGVLQLTEEGITWFVNKQVLLKMTWEQWALTATMSPPLTESSRESGL